MDQNNYSWGHAKRYNDFSSYFKNLFTERVQKVSVDAGFTCPNRDGTRGWGGCHYCNNNAFTPSYCNPGNTVTDQIIKGIRFFERKYESMRYLAYFQAFTNTYAPLENLKRLYEEALNHPKIAGLVIATRPDSLPVEVLDYLTQLSRKVYLMIEIGVETHLDKTLEKLNRGHAFHESVTALKQTADRGLNNCAHLILGLPGETRSDWLQQAEIISNLPVKNIKLHQLQILKGTMMEKQYYNNQGHFHIFTLDEYIDLIVDYLELLNPDIIVERFVSQSPSEILIAPRWGPKNFEILAKVEKRLEKRNTYQGRLYKG